MAGSGSYPHLSCACLRIPSQSLLRGLTLGLMASWQGHFQPESQGRAGSGEGEAPGLQAQGGVRARAAGWRPR